MTHSQKSPSQETENIPTIGASKLVTYSLVFLGLLTEYFAIFSILRSSSNLNDRLESTLFDITMIAVIFMMLHQFLIFRNFHILDNIPSKDYEKYSIGNWVKKSRWENLLRVLLFLLFACLTGEVIYLLIIGGKLIGSLNLQIIDGRTYYDLNWITYFYVWIALAMSSLMLLWDLIAIKVDDVQISFKDIIPTRKGLSRFNKSNAIVCYPLEKPYYIFLLSDAFGFFFLGLFGRSCRTSSPCLNDRNNNINLNLCKYYYFPFSGRMENKQIKA